MIDVVIKVADNRVNEAGVTVEFDEKDTDMTSKGTTKPTTSEKVFAVANSHQ